MPREELLCLAQCRVSHYPDTDRRRDASTALRLCPGRSDGTTFGGKGRGPSRAVSDVGSKGRRPVPRKRRAIRADGSHVLLWMALATLGAAGTVAGRWVLRPADGLGRTRSFPLVSVAALGVLGGAMLIPVARHHQLEQRLDRVASELVGAPVSVHCQTPSEEFVDAGAELGYVRWGPGGVPEHRTVIKREPCADLRAYAGSDKQAPSLDEVIAVHVLTHEAMHMAGEKSEALTECRAVQRDAWTAQLLGATPDQAMQLARRYFADVYPRMDEGYVSPDCAPGGAMDERLTTSPWS